MRRLLLAFALILLSSPAFGASHVAAAPDEESYVSLTLLAGLGSSSDRFGDGDVTRFSAALDYPIAERFTLLARWDHDETRWADLLWRSRCMPLLDQSTGSNVYSFGMRINFR